MPAKLMQTPKTAADSQRQISTAPVLPPAMASNANYLSAMENYSYASSAIQRRETPAAQPGSRSGAEAGSTGLPGKLKSGVEALSGMSLDNVRVHYNSAQPARLHALAFTQGTDIFIAPGQERHLAHEAWHVVQQAQGRVKPTMQMKGGAQVNNDAGLEREADAMGARAMAANPATGPLHLDGRAIARGRGDGAVQRMGEDELAQLDPGELSIYRDWIEWAKVYGGARKSEAQVLDEYTVAGLEGALSEYTTNPWRRYIRLFASMARTGNIPLEMYQVMIFDDIAQVKAPELALDLTRLAGIKGLGLDELVAHLNAWKDVVEPRGYPFPFTSPENFDRFKARIGALVEALGIHPTAIRVQGSSLRNPAPGDIDIGVMVDQAEYTRLGVILSAAETSTRAQKQTAKALAKGKIDPRQLSFLNKSADNVIRVFELAKAAAVAGGVDLKVQVSVILIGSGFDSAPFLNF